MAWHVSEELLRGFIAGASSKEEGQRIVRHLVRGCERCARMMASTWLGEGAEEADYEAAFAEAFKFATEMEEQLAIERLRGWAQWSALEPLFPAARIAVVRSQPAYHTFGLYERLLEAAQWYSRRDPAEAADIAMLALVVAEHIPTLEGAARADLRATTWAHVANMRRLASDFEGAREAINGAWRIFEEEGSGDPSDRALIISLEASYLDDVGEFEVAESHLETALNLYKSLGDLHLQGRTLIQMGDIIGHVDPARGIRRIMRGLELITPAKEPRLELCAKHDLAWYTCELGRPDEALAFLDRARPLYALHQDSYTQLRLHWLEGKIAFARGEVDEAQNVFARLWDEFHARDLHQEMVLVAIDFAEVLAMKGEIEGAATLVREVHTIMANWKLHRYALAAWLYFERLLTEGRWSHVFAKLRIYYRRHWNRAEAFEEVV